MKTDTSLNCQGFDGTVGGALDNSDAPYNQSLKLFYPNQYLCKANQNENLYDPYQPEVLFHAEGSGTRLCTPIDIQRDSSGNPTLTPNPQGTLIPIPTPVRFNPVVLNQITLPNGQHYEFLYNQYGEISKITYPTGSYETFEYGGVAYSRARRVPTSRLIGKLIEELPPAEFLMKMAFFNKNGIIHPVSLTPRLLNRILRSRPRRQNRLPQMLRVLPRRLFCSVTGRTRNSVTAI